MMKSLLRAVSAGLLVTVAGLGALQASADVTLKNGHPQVYYVKQGDTLWDISKHFFDSPWAWPELWSKNNQVLNPRLIYPGNRLRIYKKDGVISITQVPEEEVAMETVQETASVAIQEPPTPPAPPAEII